jgi:hypothetical protein
MSTPRITYPSNGGLNNPAFRYRTSADLKTTFSQVRASRVAESQVPVRHSSVVLLTDSVRPVKRFGGI